MSVSESSNVCRFPRYDEMSSQSRKSFRLRDYRQNELSEW